MTERRRLITEYLLILPVYIAIAVPIAVILKTVAPGSMNIGFFLCYFAVDLMICAVSLIAGKEKWDIVFMAAAAVILSVIFRDMVLVANIMAALGVYAVIYFVRIPKLQRFGWLVAAAAEIAACIMICEKTLPKYAAVCLVILIIHGIATLIGKDIRYYMAVPLLIVIAAMFIPVKEEPYDWNFVVKAIDKAGKLWVKMKDETVYFFEGFGDGGLGYTGYSGTGKVTSGIKEYEREELFFDNQDKKLPIYLKGNSLTGFGKDGMTDPEQEENYQYWFAAFINTLYHAGVNDKEASYFSKIMSAEFQYKYLRTKDLIRPGTVLFIDYISDKTDKKKKKGYTYTVHYVALDTASPYFRKVIESINPDDLPASYDSIVSYVRSVYKIDFMNIMSEEDYLAAIAPKDMSRYLDTSMATDRMRTLTEDITKGCETDYEKALAIEKYLRKYKYSTGVDLTDSENYIDSFLFETGKGYCIHFAASMTMLLRIAGIPSKYSVGYYHENSKLTSVMSTEAHAWPEAYISGIGWISFEPTPVYVTAADIGWGLGEPEEDEGEAVEDTTQEENDYWKEYIPDSDADSEDLVEWRQNRDQEAYLRRKTILRFLLYAALLTAAAFLFVAILKLIAYIRYTHLTPEEQLKSNMNHIFHAMDEPAEKKKGKKKKSIYEYPDMIQDETYRERLKKLIEVYSRVRFRGDPADEESVRDSREMFRKIRKVTSHITV